MNIVFLSPLFFNDRCNARIEGMNKRSHHSGVARGEKDGVTRPEEQALGRINTFIFAVI